jgi:hypothetical protein
VSRKKKKKKKKKNDQLRRSLPTTIICLSSSCGRFCRLKRICKSFSRSAELPCNLTMLSNRGMTSSRLFKMTLEMMRGNVCEAMSTRLSRVMPSLRGSSISWTALKGRLVWHCLRTSRRKVAGRYLRITESTINEGGTTRQE